MGLCVGLRTAQLMSMLEARQPGSELSSEHTRTYPVCVKVLKAKLSGTGKQFSV